jgi:response regulator of citrate/malate metabolism
MDRVPSASAPVRVLIVDDQPRFHQIARELIDATVGFEFCSPDGDPRRVKIPR